MRVAVFPFTRGSSEVQGGDKLLDPYAMPSRSHIPPCRAVPRRRAPRRPTALHGCALY